MKTQWCLLYDFGKQVLTGLIDVLDYGLQKSGRYRMQWKSDDNIEGHLDAISRHQMDIREGNYFDDETGKPNGLHIAARGLIIAWHSFKRKV